MANRSASSSVDRILTRLPPEEREKVTSQIKTKVEEQLRTLEAKKVRPGTLGKSDSNEVRAAVLISHCCSETISVVKLAESCGTNKKIFKELSYKIGNYFKSSSKKPLSYSTKKKRNSATPSAAGPAAKRQHLAHQTSPIISESIIPTLSLVLGSDVSDSAGFSQRAQQLFDNIQHHVMRMNNRHRRLDHLNDMRDNRRVYEAACFSAVAGSQALIERLIQVADIRERDFTQTLQVVRGFRDEIEQLQTVKRTATKKSKHKEAKSLLQTVDEENSSLGIADDTEKDTRPKKFVYSKEYLEWRNRALQNSIDDVNKKQSSALTDSECLESAACGILAQYRRTDAEVTVL